MAKKKAKPVKASSTRPAKKKEEQDGALSRKQLGFIVLSYFGGVVAGNYLGKWSGFGGAGLIGVGIWKKNPYLTGLGAGALFSAGQNAVKENLSGNEDEMEGFDFKKFVSDGNERAKNYFQVLGQKFMLTKPAESKTTNSSTTTQENTATTNGMNGDENQEEKQVYFIPQGNNLNDIDYMSKLDDQIKQLTGTQDAEEPVEGTGEIDLDSGRNY